MKNQSVFIQLIIAFLAILLLFPFLGSVHLFDWDEINFAESAREMLVTGDLLTVQINFEPFWEKPPLFIWMQALSMKIFGVNEFAARFPNALCGVITFLVLFNVGRRLKDNRFGIIWVLMFACSFFPFFYFKSGIIDPWFNLFIFLGVYYFIRFTAPENTGNSYLQVTASAFFIGLAVLTKGPVALLIFLLTWFVYLLWVRFKWKYNWKQVLLFSGVLIFVGCFWFILQILSGNFQVVIDFIVYQIRLFTTEDAGHGGFFLYHFVILLIGVFPASVIALPTFRRKILKSEDNPDRAHFFRWMMILFWVVLILFTIVKTKIIHYSSMCYFPLTFLAAWQIDRVLDKKEKFYLFQKITLAVIAFVFGVALTAVTLFDKFKDKLIPHVDEFTAGNLQATSDWIGFEPLIGIVLIVTTFIFCFKAKSYPSQKMLATLLLGSLFFIASAMVFVVPNVEKYTQAAVIEFLESKKGEDCYIYTTHKSYAPYFYSDRQPENNNQDGDYLMYGDIDKTCYFIMRNTTQRVADFQERVKDAEWLYDKNGFAFFVRKNRIKQN